MSQIAKINNGSGPVPPEVATQYVLDDGIAVPAANSLNVFGETTEEDNDNGIMTIADPDPGDNLFIALTNRLFGEVESEEGTVENLITFTLASSAASYRFNFDVIGRETTTGATVGYSVDGTAKTNGTTASLVATPFIDNDEDATLIDSDIDLVVSGNDVILQVTGVIGTTITYKAVGLYVVV